MRPLFRLLIHQPVGWLIVGGAALHWTIPVTVTALFIYYERNEEHWLRDQAWRDVAGALWGAAEAAVLWGILALL